MPGVFYIFTNVSGLYNPCTIYISIKSWPFYGHTGFLFRGWIAAQCQLCHSKRRAELHSEHLPTRISQAWRSQRLACKQYCWVNPSLWDQRIASVQVHTYSWCTCFKVIFFFFFCKGRACALHLHFARSSILRSFIWFAMALAWLNKAIFVYRSLVSYILDKTWWCPVFQCLALNVFHLFNV